MSSLEYRYIRFLDDSLINEIGESNIPPANWYQTNELEYYFDIEIDNKQARIDVEFQEMNQEVHRQYFLPFAYWKSNKVYNLSYKVEKNQFQYKRSNSKILFKILSTVVDIIKKFISKNIPDCIYIEGTPKSKESSDIQKNSIYKAYLLHQIGLINKYTIQERKDGFVVCKKLNESLTKSEIKQLIREELRYFNR